MYTLASPLPPPQRDGFLRLIAAKLSDFRPEQRGVGLVHRLACEAQRDLLKGGGPVAIGPSGKYGRSQFKRRSQQR